MKFLVWIGAFLLGLKWRASRRAQQDSLQATRRKTDQLLRAQEAKLAEAAAPVEKTQASPPRAA